MSSIDNRIVNMRFDNAQFEQGIKTTSNSLSKFNQDLTALSSTNFDNSLGQIASSVDHIAGRFSWVGEMAQQMRERVVSAIMDVADAVGQKLMMASPFFAMSDGFEEYELKMNATKTILNSTNESLETVNKYLKDLDNYADATIYSLRDMTSNIGKFTNAGMKLEQAVPVMKGIANLAAISGTNAQDASRAMYNFSQAFSMGYMEMRDWRTMENTGMATQEFKRYVLEAAVAAGTLEKSANGMYRSLTTNARGKRSDWFEVNEGFRGSLNHQWMSTKAMTDALQDYGNMQTSIGQKGMEAAQEIRTFTKLMDTLTEAAGTGWSDSFQLIIGTMDESTALYTRVGNVISGIMQGTAEARNAMLAEWKNNAGRDAVIEGLASAFNSLRAVLGTLGTAWSQAFPPITGKILADLSKSFASLMASMIPSEETINRLIRIFHGLFSALKIILPIFLAFQIGVGGFASILFKIGMAMGITNANFLEFIATIGDYVTIMVNALLATVDFPQLFSAIGNFIVIAQGKIMAMVDFLKANPLVQGLIDGFKNGISMVIDSVVKMVGSIINTFKNLLGIHSPSQVFFDMGLNIAQGLVLGLKASFSLVSGIITGLGRAMMDAFNEKFQSTSNFFNIIGEWISGGLSNSLDIIKKSFQSIGSVLNSMGTWIATSFQKNFSSAYDSLSGFSSNVSTLDFSVLDTISGKFRRFIQESAAINFVVDKFNQFIDVCKFVWGWLKSTFGPTIDYLIENFRKLTFKDVIDGTVLIAITRTIITFLASLTSAFGNISKFVGGFLNSFGDIVKGFGGLGEAVTGVTGAFGNVLNSVGDSLKTFQSQVKAKVIMNIAMAIAILTVSLWGISKLNWEELKVGLTAIGSLIVGLVAAMQGLRGVKFGGATQLMAIAASILLMTFALKTLSSTGMSITPAIMGLTAVLGIFILFTRFAGSQQILISSMQLISLGIGMRLLAGGIAVMASAPWDRLLASMTALIGVLAGMTGFVHFTNPAKFTVIAASMISMSTGIWILSHALTNFANLKDNQMTDGFLRIGATIAMLGFTIRAFPTTGPVKLLGFAIGLTALLYPIKKFTEMDLPVFQSGLTRIGFALLVVGTTLRAFPAQGAPKLLGLAAALILLAIPIKILGNMNLWTLTKGLGALAIGLIVLSAGIGAMNIVLSIFGNRSFAGIIAKLALALTLLAIPISILGNMDFSTLVKGLFAIAGGLVALGAGLMVMNVLLNKSGNQKIALMGMAVALTFLAIPISILGNMDLWTLAKGILGIGVVLVVLAKGMSAIFSSGSAGEMIKTSAALILISVALSLLIFPLALFGLIPYAVIGQGLLFVAGLLATLALTLRFLPNGVEMLSLSKNLIVLSGSLLILGAAVVVLGLFKWETVATGLALLAGSLFTIVVALKLLPKDLVAISGKLILLNLAILMLAGGLAAIGLLGMDRVIAGLVAVIGALTAVGVAVYLFPDQAKCLGLAIGLSAVAAALFILALPLKLLSQIPIMKLVGVLGLMAVVMVGVVVGSMALGAAAFPLGMFGLALLAVSSAIYVLALAFETLLDQFSRVGDWISGLLEWLGLKSTPVNAGELARYIDRETNEMKTVAEKNMDPSDYDAMASNALQAIAKRTESEGKQVTQSMSNVTEDAHNAFKNGMDPLVYREDGRGIMREVSLGIEDGKPEIDKATNDIQSRILASIGGGVNGTDFSEITKQIISDPNNGLLGGMLEGEKNIDALLKSGQFDMSGKLKENFKIEDFYEIYNNAFVGENGALGAVKNGGDEILTNVKQLGTDISETITNDLDPTKMETSMRNYLSGADTAVDEAKISLSTKVTEMGDSVVVATSESLSQDKFAPVGESIVNGLITGIESGESLLMAKITQLANDAAEAARVALDSHSPSRVFAAIGEDVNNGLAMGISQNSDTVLDSIHTVGTEASDTMRETLSGINLNDIDMDTKPVITPVLDLTDVEKGANNIPQMLNRVNHSVNVNAQATGAQVTRSRMTVRENTGIVAPTPSSPNSPVINNVFNVRHESDARQISNKLGTLIIRQRYQQGVVTA